MPWTTAVPLAASSWKSVQERLLVKFRSVGERIENFMATWSNSRRLMLNELGMETDRKENIVGSLTNLGHEVDALVQRCSESGGLATTAFFLVSWSFSS